MIPQDYPEYYASPPLKEKGINPEATFKDFISDRKLREIEPIDDTIDVLGRAQKMGYWIQLLTARPDQNLICLYDTYHWINQMNIPFDGLAFSGEKYRWVVQSPFYGHVAACIDDSPKHAAEYATHGLLVLSPELSYNTSLKDVKNVIHYSNAKQLLTELTNIIKDNKNNATES